MTKEQKVQEVLNSLDNKESQKVEYIGAIQFLMKSGAKVVYTKSKTHSVSDLDKDKLVSTYITLDIRYRPGANKILSVL